MEPLFDALNRATEGAYVIDSDQQIVFWNAAAAELLGYHADEVMGRPCFEVVRGRNEDKRAWCRTNCRVATQSSMGEPVESFSICSPTKSGAGRWINVSILPYPAPTDDGSRWVVHLFRDGTAQRKNEGLARQILDVVQAVQDQSASSRSLNGGDPTDFQLTTREQEVLECLAQGLGTRDIADALSISVATTRNHVQNIFHKLDVHSRAQAVAFAFEHRLVSAG